MDPLTIVVIGIFLGVFTRTMIPYLKKLKEAQSAVPPSPFKFDVNFIYTALLSLIISGVATAFLLPTYQMVADQVPLLVWSSAFTTGYTADSVINNVIS